MAPSFPSSGGLATALARVLLLGLIPFAAGTAAAVAGQATPLPTPAATTAPASTEVEVNTSYDHLSNGYGTWHSVGLDVAERLDPHVRLDVNGESVQRFDRSDTAYGAGAQFRFSARSGGSLAAEVSPTHRTLPSFALRGEYEGVLPSGFGAAIAADQRSYDLGNVGIDTLTLERYRGDARVAYAVALSTLTGAGSALSQRLTAGRYFAGDARIEITAGLGRERENDGVAITTQTVRTLVLSGVQPVFSAWSLSYGLENVRQGTLYTRTGLRLGLRRRT